MKKFLKKSLDKNTIKKNNNNNIYFNINYYFNKYN